jgi:hypothetical protein
MLDNINLTEIGNAYAIISAFFGWKFISRIQRNFVFFTTITDYFLTKFILSFLVGWIVAPFYILSFIFKMIFWKKSKKSNVYNLR